MIAALFGCAAVNNNYLRVLSQPGGNRFDHGYGHIKPAKIQGIGFDCSEIT
jgi:hypothetical protein